MVHILDLPDETILHIFTQYLATEKQKDFYLNIARVCKKWKNISKDSIFWKKFDGSLSENHLLELSRNGCLSKTEELVYSLSKQLQHTKNLEEIFKSLPNLKSIDFSKVRDLKESTLTCLSKYCKLLCSIKFSQEDYDTELKMLGYSSKKRDDMKFQKYNVSAKMLNDYLEIHGQNMTLVDISHSNIAHFTTLLISIANCCPNLEKLFIENVNCSGKSVFPIDVIQNKCCKIKDLRLGFPVTFTQHLTNSLPGFPKLETFAHPNKEESSFTDKDFINMLFNSPSLKTLDIRGCKSISMNAMLSLPATHLEHLYLSGTRLHISSYLGVILEKWIKSLRTLDVSRTISDAINKVLSSLASQGVMVKLEYLDLSNTRVNEETVCAILENCNKLHLLNLTSCRSIGRGFNQEYLGRAALEKFHRDLLCQFGRKPQKLNIAF